MSLEILQQYVIYISAGIAGFIVLSFVFYAMKRPSKTVHYTAQEPVKIDEPAPKAEQAVEVKEIEPIEPSPAEMPSSAREVLLKPAPRFTTINKVAPDIKSNPQPPPTTPPPPKTNHWS